MKFVQFTTNSRTKGSKGRKGVRVGYISGDCVVDLYDHDYELPTTMIDFLQNDYYWKRLGQKKDSLPFCTAKLQNVSLKAPINGMNKVMGIVVNYKDLYEKAEAIRKAEEREKEMEKEKEKEKQRQLELEKAKKDDDSDKDEEEEKDRGGKNKAVRPALKSAKEKEQERLMKLEEERKKILEEEKARIRWEYKHKYSNLPEVPAIFAKFPSTVIGPSDPVLIRTNVANKVDYEAELCVVIGRNTTEVKAKDAYHHVFGYTIAQDISARDWHDETNDGQHTIGSSMDNFCPIGPWIVTQDEIGDVNNLNIKCSLNGVCKQDSNTKNFIFKIPEIIERISSVMTLKPGDLILTGTPAGIGMFCKPETYLKPGDVLTSEIENIGVLETRIEEYIPPERIPKHKEILWPY